MAKKTENRQSLIVHDPLDLYTREIRKLPVLAREEERDLAMRWYFDHDRDAAQKLVISNLRFVVKIANEYTKYGFKLSDLVQEGNLGLLHAVQKFDPTKGYRLISYAVWWIRAYIQSFILNSWSMVRMGTTRAQRKIFASLQRARERIRALGPGEPATRKQIASELNMSEEKLDETMNRMRSRDLSMEQPLSDDSTVTVGDAMTDHTPTVEIQLIEDGMRASVRTKIDEIYDDLSPRERYLLEKRLMAEDPITLESAGSEWGITRERVRQIESRLKSKIRQAVEPIVQP